MLWCFVGAFPAKRVLCVLVAQLINLRFASTYDAAGYTLVQYSASCENSNRATKSMYADKDGGRTKKGKSYTLAITKVEESEEQKILGPGELYLDSIMKDLRELYLEVEAKIGPSLTRGSKYL